MPRHTFASKRAGKQHPMRAISIVGREGAQFEDSKIVYAERAERSINRVRSELPKFAELATNYEARLLRGAISKPRK